VHLKETSFGPLEHLRALDVCLPKGCLRVSTPRGSGVAPPALRAWKNFGVPPDGEAECLFSVVRPPGLEPRTCGPANPNELSLLVEADVGELVG